MIIAKLIAATCLVILIALAAGLVVAAFCGTVDCEVSE